MIYKTLLTLTLILMMLSGCEETQKSKTSSYYLEIRGTTYVDAENESRLKYLPGTIRNITPEQLKDFEWASPDLMPLIVPKNAVETYITRTRGFGKPSRLLLETCGCNCMDHCAGCTGKQKEVCLLICSKANGIPVDEKTTLEYGIHYSDWPPFKLNGDYIILIDPISTDDLGFERIKNGEPYAPTIEEIYSLFKELNQVTGAMTIRSKPQ